MLEANSKLSKGIIFYSTDMVCFHQMSPRSYILRVVKIYVVSRSSLIDNSQLAELIKSSCANLTMHHEKFNFWTFFTRLILFFFTFLWGKICFLSNCSIVISVMHWNIQISMVKEFDYENAQSSLILVLWMEGYVAHCWCAVVCP
jgi:hypothetical protein